MLAKDYNIIPIGDHCATAIILKELDIRKCSYPFDWVTMNNPWRNTNIYLIIDTLWRIKCDNILSITTEYIGDAFYNGYKLNKKSKTWFAHDSEDFNENFSKYLRRFQRLYTDLTEKKNVFLLIIRNHMIIEEHFDIIVKVLSGFNNENRIVFICGIDHPYFYSNNNNNISEKYKDRVVFKHIFFDFEKGFSYDDVFRKNCKEYLRELLI